MVSMFRGNAVDVDPLNPMLFRCEKTKGNRRQYSTVHFISLKSKFPSSPSVCSRVERSKSALLFNKIITFVSPLSVAPIFTSNYSDFSSE